MPGALIAALAGRYRIERELGSGGMATVYLAQDLKHDRKVAVKVLKPELAAVLGAERFVAEIKTTAALQHPHILPLFDSGEAASPERSEGTSFLYYVMPFIDGETLRARLDRETQLGVEEAVRITRDVADALDYAHRHGVIHRDIKPENILLHDGRPVVADFGIALAVSAAAGGRMTETGLSLGTPHYMSPEQATADKDISARSDIYSLASVLYEMLAGQPPHLGGSAQQIIMKIITEPVEPVTRYRKAVPPNVAAALAVALEKLPADRFETARSFAEALGNAAFTTSGMAAVAVTTQRQGWHRYAAAIIAGLGLVTVASIALAVRGRLETAPAPVSHLSLALPASKGLTAPGGTRLVWAADGRSFVYVGPGNGGTQLWRRSLDALEPAPIPGTEGATSPFLSPDGTRIGYITYNPFELRLAVPAGGASTRVVGGSDVSGGGAVWGEDGFIYFDGLTTLSRVRPDGTGREVVYALDSLQREVGVAWPEVLPGGSGVLFRVRHIGDAVGDFRIMVTDLRTRKTKPLMQALVARYSAAGYLLYVTADGSLMASRFDPDRLEMIGSPVPLWRGIGLGAFGVVDVALSSTGSLLYTTDDQSTIAEPTWLTRAGVATTMDAQWPDGLAYSVALSPDGSQVAVEFINVKSSTSVPDIWIKRLGGGPLSRLTYEGTDNLRPSWSRDGRDVFYISNRRGSLAFYRQRADGSTPAEQIASDPRGLGEGLESGDGQWLVLRTADDVCCDILAMKRGVDSMPKPLVASSFRERSPSLSPDGKWLAYASDETGRFEVFVRPFPDAQSAKWQVSSDGGTSPHWSAQGNELFYLDGANAMQAARVTTRPTFGIVSKERLFSASGYYISPWSQAYDVTPDGQRFLMLRVASATAAAPVSLVLVENFLTELRQRMATR
jgi:eukaryotic-like serine/threonine-protein kinase